MAKRMKITPSMSYNGSFILRHLVVKICARWRSRNTGFDPNGSSFVMAQSCPSTIIPDIARCTLPLGAWWGYYRGSIFRDGEKIDLLKGACVMPLIAEHVQAQDKPVLFRGIGKGIVTVGVLCLIAGNWPGNGIAGFATIDDLQLEFLDSDPPACGAYIGSNGLAYPVGSYCTADDIKLLGPHKYTTFITNTANTGALENIELTYFGIDNLQFVDAICSLLKTKPDSVDVAIQSDQPRDGVQRIAKCAPSGTVFNEYYLGRDAYFSSFHLKILLLNDRLGRSILMTGSGNPTINSEAYHDYELIFSGSTQSDLIKWHSCVAKAVQFKPEKFSFQVVRDRYEMCIDLSGQTRELTPFFLPFDREKFLDQWRALSEEAYEIDVITQHANRSSISHSLLAALGRGTKVRIIMDDDIIWAERNRPTSADTEYFNSSSEYESWLAPLLKAGANVQFVTTNHHFQPRNFVHSKFVIFHLRSGIRVTIFGGANLTRAALYRNLENVYIGSAAQLSDRFTETFERYWNYISVPETALPLNDWPPVRKLQ